MMIRIFIQAMRACKKQKLNRFKVLSAYLVDQYVDFKEFNDFFPVHYGLCGDLNGLNLVHYVLFGDLNVFS